MVKLSVQYGQTLWDIAIQEYGHIDGVFLLVEDNPLYAITDVPVPGAEVLIRETVPRLNDTNEANVRYYKENAITVASGSETNLTLPGNYVANGYWANGYVRQNG